MIEEIPILKHRTGRSDTKFNGMYPSSNSDPLNCPRSLNGSDFILDTYCFLSPPSSFVVVAFFITYILILMPFCIFILHHGLQQWKQKQSPMNHNDCFTYHTVTIELIGVLGGFFCICGIYSNHLQLFLVGFYCFSFNWFGQIFFHVLTCVDRYLAVVHPVLYLTLKSDRGVRIRNVSVASVWLLCFAETSLMSKNFYIFINGSILTVFLITVSFCSISVLRVLIRPAAAKQKRADESKLRAFRTIAVILAVLVVRFTLSLVWGLFLIIEVNLSCLFLTSELWLNLSTSLVLPLLYVHKIHK